MTWALAMHARPVKFKRDLQLEANKSALLPALKPQQLKRRAKVRQIDRWAKSAREKEKKSVKGDGDNLRLSEQFMTGACCSPLPPLPAVAASRTQTRRCAPTLRQNLASKSIWPSQCRRHRVSSIALPSRPAAS
ncbi:hypothetical protein OUZ56_001337 [Daphnia magna]|uniref:Uncharacterized protein n=1 Tax=Daphnia magna TaxID=35525 RepID=A0ABR0A2B6_9CRUS|nr:hypothetical protein OUZ56_001337 [Daphnia magna]